MNLVLHRTACPNETQLHPRSSSPRLPAHDPRTHCVIHTNAFRQITVFRFCGVQLLRYPHPVVERSAAKATHSRVNWRLFPVALPVPTENSIGLIKAWQHSSGNGVPRSQKALVESPRCERPAVSAPGAEDHRAGSVYIVKRMRWLKLPVVRIGGEGLPPAAGQ
jgi:hypothetical protein